MDIVLKFTKETLAEHIAPDADWCRFCSSKRWRFTSSFVACKCDLLVDMSSKTLNKNSNYFLIVLFLNIFILYGLDLAFKTPLRPILRQEHVLSEMDASSSLNSTARNIYPPIMRFLTPSKESESNSCPCNPNNNHSRDWDCYFEKVFFLLFFLCTEYFCF